MWRAWLNCWPPYDRNATPRIGYVAYEHSDIFGFGAVMHDSLFAGYRAHVSGLYVLPRYRRQHAGTALFIKLAQWLQQDGITRCTADCYAADPTRNFFHRLGGFVIASATDESNPTALITYGFANLKELAARV
jgi:GNAT superfamily N-acetyltransferase